MLPDRFWSKVDKNGPVPEHRPDLGPCWLWLAAKDEKGRGRFRVNGPRRMMFAHRVVFEYVYGPIPEELELDHLCRVRHCVNYYHIELVTHYENQRRGIKGYLTTHCPYGHEYTYSNTYRYTRRQCRECAIQYRRNLRRTASDPSREEDRG